MDAGPRRAHHSPSQAEARFVLAQAPSITADAPVETLSAERPTITQIIRHADETVTITAAGAVGVPFRAWVGTNLTADDWDKLDSGTVATSTFEIEDTEATGKTQRFYRFSMP